MSKLKNEKYASSNEKDFVSNLNDATIAGGGMVVPSALQVDGMTIEAVATGLIELRPTKKSTNDNPIHYGAMEVESSDGLRFFVLNTSYQPKGTPVKIRVSKTINQETKQDQYGFNLIGSGVTASKSATAEA